VGCYIWYREEGTGWGYSLPRPLLAVPNVTSYPLTANVPISALQYNGLFLCSVNAPIKGLNEAHLNETMHIISGPLPTLLSWLPVLSHITPAHLHRWKATDKRLNE